jgi:AraC-like DNA-binding protein
VSTGTLERPAPGPVAELALERVARIASQLLRRRLDPRRRPPAEVGAAITRLMEARGAVRVDRLARELGWGARRLERRFAAAVGLAPKPFARIVRFQSLLARLPSREPDWVSLALECGYFDQSHLAGDVRSLAGVTPSALAAGRDRLAAIFTSRERLDAYFGD